MMKKLQIGELKQHFSEVISHVRDGEEIAISYGKKHELVAVIVPIEKYKKNNKRTLGSLQNKASFKVSDDFELSDEDFLDQ